MLAYRLIVPICVAGVALGVLAMAEAQDSQATGWWMNEPIRLVQTNCERPTTRSIRSTWCSSSANSLQNVLLDGDGRHRRALSEQSGIALREPAHTRRDAIRSARF